jgi:hypothetical protein
MEQDPNEGAAGQMPADTAETADAPPPEDAGPGAAGAPINQGASGAGPEGTGAYQPGPGEEQSPLSAHAASDPFERPEILVASAFVGGFAAAQILRWLGNR